MVKVLLLLACVGCGRIGFDDFAVTGDATMRQTPLKLYAAVRSSTMTPFGPPFALTALWGGGHDGDPAFSPDGCELFFVSDRGGNRDLYRATLDP